jgi:hypothetical protein
MKNLILPFAVMLLLAAGCTQGGTTGNLKWSITGDTLIISGTGKMPDYIPGETPWFGYRGRMVAVIIENGVTGIGSNAFAGCRRLASVAIPNSVTEIEWGAFSGCRCLVSVTVPNRVTWIGWQAFEDCLSLASVTIPESVTWLGDWIFRDCHGLTSVTVPAGLTWIGYGAFEGCRSLASITVPRSVTAIGTYAFSGCRRLTDVTVGWTEPLSIEENTFDSVPLTSCTLHVPPGTKALYLAAGGWKDFGTVE